MRFQDLPDDVVWEIAKRLPLDDAIPLAMASKRLAAVLAGDVAGRLKSARAAAEDVAAVALAMCVPGLTLNNVWHHEEAWKRVGVVPEDARWTLDADRAFRLGDVRLCIDDATGSWWPTTIDGSVVELKALKTLMIVRVGSLRLAIYRMFDDDANVPRFSILRTCALAPPTPPGEDTRRRAAEACDGSAGWAQAKGEMMRYEDLERRWRERKPADKLSIAKKLLLEAVARRFVET